MTKTTDDLIALLDTQHTAIKTMHQKTDMQIGEITGRLTEVEQHLARRRAPSEGGPGETLGAKVVKSEGFKQFVQRGFQGTSRIPVEAALTTLPGSAGGLIIPDQQRDPTMLPRQRLTVRSLLASGQTSSNLVKFTKQEGRTNAAAVVTEGSTKPESSITFTLAEAPVRTIATWIPATRQAMEDAPQLQSLVDTELRYFIGLTEEEEILFGDGTGEHIRGLSVQVTAFNPPFTVEANTRLDTILLAIAQAQQSKIVATGIILNDLDWLKMQTIKDSQQRYILNGPGGAISSLLWTLPVVPTPAIPEGEFMVGAFAIAAQLIDRMQTEVLVSSEASYAQDGNTVHSFIQNMLVVRAEERVALAVKIPEAIVYGEYDTVSG